MKIKTLSLLKDFKCSANKCPVSCCKGWKIPVNDKMYTRYLNQKGLLGIALRCSIEKRNNIVAFRSGLFGCPFWGIDKFCYLQKKYGQKYMPLVCIQFPRQLYNLGFFCEETLYLACPEAARLFLMHINDSLPLDFISSEREPDYGLNTTNDDGAFLDYLIKSRTQLINMLENNCPYNSNSITNYAKSAQNAALEGNPLPYPSDFEHNEINSSCHPFTCDEMNRLMFHGFYHSSLKTISPFLYRLCQKYIYELGTFSKLKPDIANQKLNILIKALYGKVDNLPNLLKRYYEYFLLTDFLDIFEDYSFSKHITFGVNKANMLLVFLAIYAKNKKSLNADEIIKIIAVFERRAPQIY
jgi:hypothetical protein